MEQPDADPILPPASPRREYPDGPIPGVGAVVLRGIGTDDDRVEVLLVKRGREPMAGSWSLPGGAIELGETTAEACAREVREETGLKVEVVAPIETVDIIVRDSPGSVRFHYLVVDMLCRAPGGELKAGGDASEAVWAGADEVLDAGAFALTARACTVIRKAVTMIGDLR